MRGISGDGSQGARAWLKKGNGRYDKKAEPVSTAIRLDGHRALLVTLTPDTLQRVQWFFPYFAATYSAVRRGPRARGCVYEGAE